MWSPGAVACIPYRLLSFQVFKEMFPYFFVLSRTIILLLKSQCVYVRMCVLLEIEPRTSCPLLKGPIMESYLQTGLSKEVTGGHKGPG